VHEVAGEVARVARVDRRGDAHRQQGAEGRAGDVLLRVPDVESLAGRLGTDRGDHPPAVSGARRRASQEQQRALADSIVRWFDDYVRRDPGELSVWKLRKLYAAKAGV